MILTPEFFYIHVPKTGGMSQTDLIINESASPIHLFTEKNSFDHARHMAKTQKALQNLILHSGRRHATPAESEQLAKNQGLDNPKLFLVPIRRIDSLMHSYYSHLRKPSVHRFRGMSPDALRGDVQAAMKLDFANFCRHEKFYALDDSGLMEYFTPPTLLTTLKIIDYRYQSKYLSQFLGGLLSGPLSIPFRNKSEVSDASNTRLEVEYEFLKSRFPMYSQLYSKVQNGVFTVTTGEYKALD